MRFEGEGLACVRGGRVVFAGLGFAAGDGDALIVTGPNGSGKSSLLRLMTGLLRAEAGRLTVDGADVTDDRAGHAARLHYVGHADAAKPQMTARETLSFWARLRGGGADDIARGLETFGLAALGDAPVRLLSAGQKRRLALARLAATRAPLWLLDEPTLGLDTASVSILLGVVRDHRASGGVAVVSTNAPLDLDGASVLDVSAFAAETAA